MYEQAFSLQTDKHTKNKRTNKHTDKYTDKHADKIRKIRDWAYPPPSWLKILATWLVWLLYNFVPAGDKDAWSGILDTTASKFTVPPFDDNLN